MLRSFWLQPQVAGAPVRVWRDWVLLGAIWIGALIETVVRPDLAWPLPSLAVCLVVSLAVLIRRTHPLAAAAAAFATTSIVQVASLVADVEWEGLFSTAFLLVLPYSLLRWGSGRQATIGIALFLTGGVIGATGEPNPVGAAVGGTVVLLLAAAIGALVRYEGALMDQRLGEARLRQREAIARELHDSVAHHVSAIAVQAQAGRAVAEVHPEAAGESLAVIEEEASRALEEMRAMVAALRDGADPDLAPQAGVHDIVRLGESAPGRPAVAVQLSGSLDDLRPSVDTALYRLAQESITNAMRHARNARTVDVAVVGDVECVRLTVRDDGEPAGSRNEGGFGLVGMAERAKLLGGTFRAGPEADRGWSVEAVLPRGGART